jgi:hypothetical protein
MIKSTLFFLIENFTHSSWTMNVSEHSFEAKNRCNNDIKLSNIWWSGPLPTYAKYFVLFDVGNGWNVGQSDDPIRRYGILHCWVRLRVISESRLNKYKIYTFFIILHNYKCLKGPCHHISYWYNISVGFFSSNNSGPLIHGKTLRIWTPYFTCRVEFENIFDNES